MPHTTREKDSFVERMKRTGLPKQLEIEPSCKGCSVELAKLQPVCWVFFFFLFVVEQFLRSLTFRNSRHWVNWYRFTNVAVHPIYQGVVNLKVASDFI